MKTSIQCESVSDVGKQSVCRKAYLASYYLKNKIKIAAKKALYDAENREKKLVYLSNNKERIAARRAVYHALNREKILSKMFIGFHAVRSTTNTSRWHCMQNLVITGRSDDFHKSYRTVYPT